MLRAFVPFLFLNGSRVLPDAWRRRVRRLVWHALRPALLCIGRVVAATGGAVIGDPQCCGTGRQQLGSRGCRTPTRDDLARGEKSLAGSKTQCHVLAGRGHAPRGFPPRGSRRRGAARGGLHAGLPCRDWQAQQRRFTHLGRHQRKAFATVAQATTTRCADRLLQYGAHARRAMRSLLRYGGRAVGLFLFQLGALRTSDQQAPGNAKIYPSRLLA